MKRWTMCVVAVVGVACSSRGGSDTGTDGTSDGTTDGVDGADGTDGTDGTDDTADGADATDATDGGTAITIAALQTSTGSVTCDPAVAKINDIQSNVTVRGAVVVAGKYVAAEPTKDPETGELKGKALDGYYIADPAGGVNSGIQMVVPATLGVTLAEGDVVDVTGTHVEYYCNTQFSATAVTKTGTAAVPAPVELAATVLATPATAEAYEGMLVTLRDITVESLDGFDYIVTGGARCSGKQYRPGYFATAGDKLGSLTGVVDFSFGHYLLQPRKLEDVVITELAPVTELPFTDMQTSSDSVGCTDGAGNAPATFKKIRVKAVVASPVQDLGEKTSAIYVVDEAGSGANAGIFVTYRKDAGIAPNIGDHVVIDGDVKEYYCLTEIQTTAIQITSAGEAPTPAEITTADLLAADAEKWEGVFVTIDCPISSKPDQYNQLGVEKDQLVLVADDFGVSWDGVEAGNVLRVTGAVSFGFGKYRIVPFGQSYVTAAE